MDKNEGMIGMALGSWLVALAGGLLAGVLLWVLGGWSFMQGAFAGFVVWIVFGGIISWIMSRPLPGPGEVSLGTAAEPAAPAPSTPAPAPSTPAAAPAATASAAPAEDAPKVKPSKRLPGEDELAARKGEWTYEKEPEAKKVGKGTKKAVKKVAPVASEPDRPGGFTDTPRDGGADDLQKITGVGPKLEETLNSLGIWHFDQVAALTKDDIAWVDERLRFKGRIERDDWVGQAKKLASGG